MPNWDNTDKEMLQIVVREAETYLQGQLEVATSADQRASVLGGIYAAAGTALVAGVIAARAQSAVFPLPVVWGAGVAGALFLLASGLCLSTAFPVQFWLPGNEPKSWHSDLDANTPIKRALGEEADNYQEKIDANDAVLKTNSRRYKFGILAGMIAPVVGVLVWLALATRP